MKVLPSNGAIRTSCRLVGSNRIYHLLWLDGVVQLLRAPGW